MKNLIIIGAGGLGREIYFHAMECNEYNKQFRIKGFIDNNINSLDNFKDYPPLLSKIDDYKISGNDVFVCAVGNVSTKKIIISKILIKGGEFISLIHPTARIAHDSKIGDGIIIMKRVDLGSNTKIGNYSFIQADSIIGHDSVIGKFVRIDCKVVCVGGIIIEDEATIHTSAVISHKVTVGRNAIVGALSLVIRNVKNNTTVVGNPAIKLM